MQAPSSLKGCDSCRWGADEHASKLEALQEGFTYKIKEDVKGSC